MLRKTYSSCALYWLPASVVAYFWIFIAGTGTDFLARWNIELFTPGLLIVVPALLMPIWRGFFVVLVSGFLFDGSLPIPYEKMESAFVGPTDQVAIFGEMSVDVPSTMGFGVMWMSIFFFALRVFRTRVDLTSPRHWLACALAVNLAIFLLWAFALGWRDCGQFSFWYGVGINALASSLFIVLLGWWFFDAVISLYRLCGIDLVVEREMEES